MFIRLCATASVAALLMAGGAVAQDNGSDVLLPKKNQSQGAGNQGGEQPAAGAMKKRQSQEGAGENAGANADAGANGAAAGQQQNAQGSDTQNADDNMQAQDQQNQTGGTKRKQQADTQSNEEKTTGSVSKADEITTEKRKVIRERIVTRNVTKIERSQINFDINVGVAVPTTIVLNPLPVEVIEIVPAYRGYQYFLLADGTIVIVEPGSHQIVFVLSA